MLTSIFSPVYPECFSGYSSFYIYGVYGTYFKGAKSFLISRWFAGNFGGANMFCKQMRLSLGKVDIRCPPGTVLETDKAVFGVISNEFSSFT